MLLEEFYITAPEQVVQRPFIEVVQELCEEIEPKPLFCELPDELKLKSVSSSGTVQMYSYANSLATTSIGWETSSFKK